MLDVIKDFLTDRTMRVCDHVKNEIKLFADDLKLICNAANHGSVAKDIEEFQ